MTENRSTDLSAIGDIVTVELPDRGSHMPGPLWIPLTATVVPLIGATLAWSAAARSHRLDLVALGLELAGLAAAFGGMSAGSLLASRSGRLRVRRTPEGLVVPGATAPVVAYWPFAILAMLGAVVLVRIRQTPDADVSLLHQLLLMAAAVCGLVLAVLLVRARPSQLVLTPEGIDADGLLEPTTTRTWIWDEIPALGSNPRPLGAMLARGNREYPERTLASDPLLVAELVEHYRTHPADRLELTDDRCLERIRTGRF